MIDTRGKASSPVGFSAEGEGMEQVLFVLVAVAAVGAVLWLLSWPTKKK